MACSDFLQPYVDWLNQSYLNIVTVVAVSTRWNQGCYYKVLRHIGSPFAPDKDQDAPLSLAQAA